MGRKGSRTSLRLLAYALAFASFFACVYSLSPKATASSGINQEIDFQGRLLNEKGAVVPDGYYNIEFKIYQDGDGQSVGDTTGTPAGTLKWTEDHTNAAGTAVEVRNGFLSVSLGSVTPFGSSIDWNQDNLWLSVNVAGTNATCTPFSACSPDGEMLPMKRLTSTPYALNAAELGGLSATSFGQLSNDQTWNGINTYTGNFIIQGGSSDNLLSVDTTASTIQVGSATTDANARLFVLDSYSGGTDPASGSDGAMYYNTSMNSFRCYTNGAWGSCSGAMQSGTFVQIAPSSAQNDSSTNSSIFLNKTGASGNLLQLQTGGNDAFVVTHNGDITLGNNASHTLAVATAASGSAGGALTIQGGNAGSGASSLTGGDLVLQGGAGGGTNGNGGNLILNGGVAAGTGTEGLVVLSTPTFSATTDDPNCYTGGALVSSSCTIATGTVDGSSTVIVGFSQNGQTAYLPDPTNKTAGRVFYISAANGSSDFTLSVNGGGAGNEVSMRQNTSATMVWNGQHWGAAGASSSTDLQAAYDNTLQSAGGAELVVSHTSNTDGLTIRDSTENPVNGTLLSVQSNSAATILSVNSNVTEYSSDSGAEIAGSASNTFPANTWGAAGAATVSRYAIVGQFIATGQGSVHVNTTSAAGDGAKNTLVSALTSNMHYNVSFATRYTGGSFTDMKVDYSPDGTTTSLVNCIQNQIVNSSIWTKVNCSFAAPASGITSGNAIMITQAGSGKTHIFYIDNLSVTIAADYNYATDPGVDDATNFATNWTAVSGSTVTRSTTIGHDASDSAKVDTTAAGQGVKNKLTIDPLLNNLYRITVYVAAPLGSGFNNFNIKYSPDGGLNFVNCADYNTQTIPDDSTSNFEQVECYVTTGSSAASNPYVYFYQADGTARTFYVDTFSMTLSTATTPNVQIGSGLNGGPVTLLTLDRAASAPIASNNDAFLGSLYYDTTLGELQCYEADGWGSCGSSPNTIVTISPEYTNAVMHGTGIGTMTSDICSGTLGINDGTNGQPTICSANETYNFYKWTSPQASAQTYGIYVTYQLPDTFKSFASGQTSLMARTDSSNSSVQYSIYRDDPTTGLTQCGPAVPVSSGSVSSWQTKAAGGASDPSTCNFAASDSIVFKIELTASQNADAYVGNLNFTFSHK